MIRGTLFLLEGDNLHYSCEFNGGMDIYDGSHGEYVLQNFIAEKIDSVEKFKQLVKDINDSFFQYDHDLVGTISIDDIKRWDFSKSGLRGEKYGFISDYLYILNLNDEDVDVKTDSGIIRIYSREGCVLHFGKLFEDFAGYVDWKSSVFITDPDDTDIFSDDVWMTYLQEEKSLTECEAKEIIQMGLHHSHSIEGCYEDIKDFGRMIIEEIFLTSKELLQLEAYIDFEAFGRDYIRESDGYYELETGRILIYNP